MFVEKKIKKNKNLIKTKKRKDKKHREKPKMCQLSRNSNENLNRVGTVW